jgi:L-arabinose isomerase
MFVNNFARRATIAMKNRRMMSGHHTEEEVHKEMGKWYKMTLGEFCANKSC